MKKREHLFEAIGLVDDRLVEEAADARRTATPWKKWAALAACLVLVIGLSASSLMVLFRGCGSSDSTAMADNTTTSETSDAATAPEEGGTESETGETTEDTATTDDSSTGSAGMDNGDLAEAPQAIGPLTADADGLTAKRAVTVWADEHLETGETMLVILDSYTLTATEDMDTVLHYGTNADATYTVTVNQAEQTVTENAGELSFPLPLAAGEEVTVAITVVIPAGPDGVAGFMLSTDGTNVAVTEQGAALDLVHRTDTEILINDFGESDGAVELEPSRTYQLELRFLP